MRILLIGAAGRMGNCIAKMILGSKHMLVATVDKRDANFSCPHYFALDDVKEDADAILDFSNHAMTEPILKFALNKNLPVVIATTGQSDSELALIREAAKCIPVFLSANMSFGVALFCSVVESVARAFPYAEVEIVETHHSAKSDAPSGTALLLAKAVRKGRGSTPDFHAEHATNPSHIASTDLDRKQDNALSLHAKTGKQTKLVANEEHFSDLSIACEDESPIVFGRSSGRKSRGEIGISSLRLGAVVGKHEVIFDTGFQTITLCHEARSRDLFAIGALNALSFIERKPAGLYSTTDILLRT